MSIREDSAGSTVLEPASGAHITTSKRTALISAAGVAAAILIVNIAYGAMALALYNDGDAVGVTRCGYARQHRLGREQMEGQICLQCA